MAEVKNFVILRLNANVTNVPTKAERNAKKRDRRAKEIIERREREREEKCGPAGTPKGEEGKCYGKMIYNVFQGLFENL